MPLSPIPHFMWNIYINLLIHLINLEKTLSNQKNTLNAKTQALQISWGLLSDLKGSRAGPTTEVTGEISRDKPQPREWLGWPPGSPLSRYSAYCSPREGGRLALALREL